MRGRVINTASRQVTVQTAEGVIDNQDTELKLKEKFH